MAASAEHQRLVEMAVQWLSSTKRLPVVVAELVTAGVVVPDAIGFRGRFSCLVEAKATRADFLADFSGEKRKPYHLPGMADHGPGQERWYLLAPGIWRESDRQILPPDWGVLEGGDKVRMRVALPPFTTLRPARSPHDMILMASILRRLMEGQKLHQGRFHLDPLMSWSGPSRP